MKSVIQELHDSEINVQVASQYDGCWLVRIGCNAFSIQDYNESNCVAESHSCASFDEVEGWLEATAIELYPDSKFARARRRAV